MVPHRSQILANFLFAHEPIVLLSQRSAVRIHLGALVKLQCHWVLGGKSDFADAVRLARVVQGVNSTALRKRSSQRTMRHESSRVGLTGPRKDAAARIKPQTQPSC